MNDSLVEGLKEIWRWFWSYILAQTFITAIGFLISALPFFPSHIIPETVMALGVSIPLRVFVTQLLIPAIVRGLDKFKFDLEKKRSYEPKGLVGFNLFNGV